MCYVLLPIMQSIKANAQIREVLFKGRMKGQEREKMWAQ